MTSNSVPHRASISSLLCTIHIHREREREGERGREGGREGREGGREGQRDDAQIEWSPEMASDPAVGQSFPEMACYPEWVVPRNRQYTCMITKNSQ